MAAYQAPLNHLKGFEAIGCYVSTEIELLKLCNQGQLVELVVVYHENLRLVHATILLQVRTGVVHHGLKIVQKVLRMHCTSYLLLQIIVHLGCIGLIATSVLAHIFTGLSSDFKMCHSERNTALLRTLIARVLNRLVLGEQLARRIIMLVIVRRYFFLFQQLIVECKLVILIRSLAALSGSICIPERNSVSSLTSTNCRVD